MMMDEGYMSFAKQAGSIFLYESSRFIRFV